MSLKAGGVGINLTAACSAFVMVGWEFCFPSVLVTDMTWPQIDILDLGCYFTGYI